MITRKRVLTHAAPKRTKEEWRKLLRSRKAQSVYVMVAGALVLLVIFLIAITPQRYHLRVADISHATITASKDVVDEKETAKQREAAARLVEPSYLFNDSITGEVLQNVSQVMAQLTIVQQYGRKVLEQAAPNDRVAQRNYQFSEAEMDYAKSLLTLISLSNYQMTTLLRTSDTDMTSLTENLSAAVENTLNTTIREGYVSESIQYMQQIIAYKTDIDLLQNVVTPVLRKCVKPNMVIDQEATSKLQEEARKAVEPVIYKQGQNIVVKNERVTANQLEMLRSLGLLDDDTVDVIMYVGAGGLLLLALLLILLVLHVFQRDLLQSPKRLMILMLALCLSLGACVLGQMVHVYLMPSLLAAMMLTGLLGAPAGLAGSLAIGILSGAVVAGGDSAYATESYSLLLTAVISGMVAVAYLRHKPYRQQLLLCALLTACTNFAIVLSSGVMTNNSTVDVLTSGLWSAAAPVLAALLCLGLDPMLESVFHLASPNKLLELCNPNQPLMRRLLMEAPGTYHHSIIVANLAEAAAEAIGASPLLARAGAYYHDIGKLKRPLYFKENQLGENPHSHTNPYVSAAIVTAHTRDGLMMAQQARLPEEIQNIIIEHHGDTPVMFFYHKALQQADGQPVDIGDFRYDGTRPHLKESAIVMLADTVEAAVRSMIDPTPKAIEDFIVRLVRGKLEDGQLSNAPITMRDLDKICEAFSTVLNGVFHERIEYPAPTPTVGAPEGPKAPAASAPLPPPTQEQLRAEQLASDADETPHEKGIDTNYTEAEAMLETVIDKEKSDQS